MVGFPAASGLHRVQIHLVRNESHVLGANFFVFTIPFVRGVPIHWVLMFPRSFAEPTALLRQLLRPRLPRNCRKNRYSSHSGVLRLLLTSSLSLRIA
jgi:hypothetical protein